MSRHERGPVQDRPDRPWVGWGPLDRISATGQVDPRYLERFNKGLENCIYIEPLSDDLTPNEVFERYRAVIEPLLAGPSVVSLDDYLASWDLIAITVLDEGASIDSLSADEFVEAVEDYAAEIALHGDRDA